MQSDRLMQSDTPTMVSHQPGGHHGQTHPLGSLAHTPSARRPGGAAQSALPEGLGGRAVSGEAPVPAAGADLRQEAEEGRAAAAVGAEVLRQLDAPPVQQRPREHRLRERESVCVCVRERERERERESE
jgi:hypothetical protein